MKQNTTEKKERIEKLANEVMKPIMEKVCEVAFNCFESFRGDSDELIRIPFMLNEGLIDTFDEAIEYMESQASHYDSASIIGYAMGRDGGKPARQYRSMAEITKALKELIKVKDDQIQEELQDRKCQQLADVMGF